SYESLSIARRPLLNDLEPNGEIVDHSLVQVVTTFPNIAFAGVFDVDSYQAVIALLRASAVVAATGLVVWLTLRLTKMQSPVVRRTLALCVILQGCIVGRWTLDVPWYTSAADRAAPQESVPVTVSALSASGCDGIADTHEQASGVAANQSRLHNLDVASADSPARQWPERLLVIWLAGLTGILGLAIALYVRLWLLIRRQRQTSAAEPAEGRGALTPRRLADKPRGAFCFTRDCRHLV